MNLLDLEKDHFCLDVELTNILVLMVYFIVFLSKFYIINILTVKYLKDENNEKESPILKSLQIKMKLLCDSG